MPEDWKNRIRSEMLCNRKNRFQHFRFSKLKKVYFQCFVLLLKSKCGPADIIKFVKALKGKLGTLYR